jgi:hypothetical protein
MQVLQIQCIFEACELVLHASPQDVSEVEAFNAGFNLFLIKFGSSIADDILHLLSTHRK